MGAGAGQVQMTPEMAVAYFKQKVTGLRKALGVNRRAMAGLTASQETLSRSLPCTMSGMVETVSAIGGAVDALLVAQIEQMKLIVEGQEADIAAAEKQVEAIQSPSMIVPPRRG